MARFLACFVLLAATLAAHTVTAQGVLINIEPGQQVALPRPHVVIWPPYPPYPPVPPPVIIRPEPPPESVYKIKELSVNTRIVDQVAKVQVSQSFVNTGSRQMEVCFVFPLPYDGAIDQLTLLVDGKEFPARLIKAEEARRMYEDIVRKNRDPALLEWMGTGMFKTSVFPVPPGAERKVTLRYSQLCRKFDGMTDFLFPLSTAKYTSHPVESVQIEVSIESQADIKNVYSPNHAVEIQRPDNKHATVKLSTKNEVPTADFRLLYDVGKGQVGTSVLSYRPDAGDDGYFLLLTSPEIKAEGAEVPKKTVLFVVDRSGSMSGEKMQQAKNAAKFVLNNLKQGDLFNVIAYDSEVESWRPELQTFNDETRQSALGFVESLYAGGSTNIHGALSAAMGQLKDQTRPNYLIFLTDGLPTVGETNEGKIVQNAKKANGVRARVFAFGVGYDVNSRLLDRLVRENFGQSEYVRPNEDIEAKVSAFYQRIGSPVMTALAIKFDVEGAKTEDGGPVNRYYPKESHDLFAGEQLVLVGRYKKPGAAKVTVGGMVGDKHQQFDFPATLTEKSSDDSYAFIEKLWAIRRVGEIIDEIDLKGKNDELINELVGLSTKHGILTPYTSFLADENANPQNLTLNVQRASERAEMLKETGGQFGFTLRSSKGSSQRAANVPANAGADRDLFEAEIQLEAAADSAATPSSEGLAGQGGAFSGRGRRLSRGGSSISGPVGGSGAAPVLTLSDEEVKQEQARVAQAVRNVGRKAFYRRGDTWIDSTVTEAQEKKVQKIERFSKEYFDLVEKHGKDVAKYLAFDEPVIVEIDGQAYSF